MFGFSSLFFSEKHKKHYKNNTFLVFSVFSRTGFKNMNQTLKFLVKNFEKGRKNVEQTCITGRYYKGWINGMTGRIHHLIRQTNPSNIIWKKRGGKKEEGNKKLGKEVETKANKRSDHKIMIFSCIRLLLKPKTKIKLL